MAALDTNIKILSDVRIKGSLVDGVLGSPGSTISSAPPADLFTSGFDASWELDLWGHVRRQVEAADAQVQSSEEQRRDALVSSLAETARDYIQLRGTQTLIKIAKDNLKNRAGHFAIDANASAEGLDDQSRRRKRRRAGRSHPCPAAQPGTAGSAADQRPELSARPAARRAARRTRHCEISAADACAGSDRHSLRAGAAAPGYSRRGSAASRGNRRHRGGGRRILSIRSIERIGGLRRSRSRELFEGQCAPIHSRSEHFDADLPGRPAEGDVGASQGAAAGGGDRLSQDRAASLARRRQRPRRPPNRTAAPRPAGQPSRAFATGLVAGPRPLQ